VNAGAGHRPGGDGGLVVAALEGDPQPQQQLRVRVRVRVSADSLSAT
jgi:hypothetical protein